MLKKIQTKRKKHQNKQTNRIPKPQTNKNHHKPQNHAWNRLKESSRNILSFTVVKSVFKHLKKIKSTIKKSDLALRIPDFASTSVLSQKVSTCTLCACCSYISSQPTALPKTQCCIGLLILFLQHKTKSRRVY